MTTYKAAWSLKTTDFGNLARSGENNAESIVFDCSKVLEEYPDATIKCIIRRSGDTEPYPATLTESGTTRTLVLSSTETAMEGTITIELRAVADNDFVYKSAYYKGRILSSLNGEGDAPGEPIADILNTLEERAETASTAATAAQTVADALTAAKEAGEFNGKDGVDGKDGAQGAKGDPGKNGTDGYSPTAVVTQTDTGATLTVTDKDGTTTATILHGEKGDPGEKGETGATGATGSQGAQGEKGEKGDKGDTGATGADGYSPTATVVKTGDTATITVTDKTGTTTAEVKDGSDATVTKENVAAALGYEPADIPHKFQLIQEITLESGISVLSLTNQTLKEIYVLFIQPNTGFAAFNLNTNIYFNKTVGVSTSLYGWWSVMGAAANQQSMGYVQVRGNLVDAAFQQMHSYMMMQTNPRVLKYICDDNTIITGIQLKPDSTAFPTGMTVKIYGVRA